MVKYKVEANHVELYFDDIPNEKLRESLKICGWRWIKTKRCWSNFLTNENVVLAESLCKEMNPAPKSVVASLERCSISMGDLLVRSNSFYCNKHHELQDMAGEIELRDYKGYITKYLIPIVYCKTCNVFYVLEETYLALKATGKVIMCQIMSYKEYRNMLEGNITPQLQEVSPLRKWGYTVSQVEGYSEKQRQTILEDIVDYGGMSKNEVLSYLDFFIRLNQHKGSLAISKWKADREHIANYKLGSANRIRVGSITIIEHI